MDVTVTTNAGAMVANLAARAAALRNLRPVLKDIAAEVDKLTAEAFEKSRRVDGLPFADLADATIIGRLRQRKGKWNKATRAGKVSKEERRAFNSLRRKKSIYARMAGEAAMRQSKLDAQSEKALRSAGGNRFRAATILANEAGLSRQEAFRQLSARGLLRNAAALRAAKEANFKPLINTGRMRNSAKARVVGESTVRWAVVDYGVPHITGTQNARPPQRNPSVFRIINGAWVLHEKVAASIARKLVAHITKPEHDAKMDKARAADERAAAKARKGKP